MEKLLTIDGKKVGFKASALTPRIYRHKIGRDMIQDLNKLIRSYNKAVRASGLRKQDDFTSEENEEYESAVKDAQLSVTDLEMFEDVAFIMARQYDSNIADTPEEWLDGFETFSVYEVLPHIIDLWQANTMTTANPKKK